MLPDSLLKTETGAPLPLFPCIMMKINRLCQ
jgi:hypothetical protein